MQNHMDGMFRFRSVILIRLVLECSTVYCANILGVFMIPSISHQVVFQPIWRELSLRGHQVTVITTDPLKDPSLTNLTEIDVSSAYALIRKHDVSNFASDSASKILLPPRLFDCYYDITDHEMNHPEFQRLVADSNRKFDVVLIESYYPAWFALASKYGAPTIGLLSLGLQIHQHDAMGNPTHSGLYPDYFVFHENVSLYEKIQSYLFEMWFRLYYKFVVVSQADSLARKHFGDKIPNVGEIEKNNTIYLQNTSPLLHYIRPNVPGIINMGQMHLKPPKALPEDLQQLLDDATEGVVYFSLGTNVLSSEISDELKNTIRQALSEIPYRVLWKYEGNHLPNKPRNVITRKWLPQQDVLAHPNVKVFVTQGGLQSIEEAISRGVPMVGIPFIADQPVNLKKVSELGIGIKLDSKTLTVEKLKSAITEVVENDKYKTRMAQVRDLLLDQPMTGLERAIWWIEYIIRHKGAPHLRSPAIDMPWHQYYQLDVLAVIFVSVFVLCSILTYCVVQMFMLQKRKIKVS